MKVNRLSMNLSIDTQLVSDSSILNKPVMQFHLLSDEAFECWTNLTGLFKLLKNDQTYQTLNAGRI